MFCKTSLDTELIYSEKFFSLTCLVSSVWVCVTSVRVCVCDLIYAWAGLCGCALFAIVVSDDTPVGFVQHTRTLTHVGMW